MGKRKECNDKSKHYVDKKELREELISSKEAGKVSDNLADMFIKITNGVAYRFGNLEYYGIMDDVKQDCLLLLLQKYSNFDPEMRNERGQKTSAFAFTTTIVYNHMRYRVSRAKSRKNKHDEMTKKAKEFIEKRERNGK